MKPILSIFLALIITILFIIITPYSGIFNLFILVLGGGIATWFSTENEIKYSLYYGAIVTVMGFFLFGNYIIILIPILAGVGGIIAKKEKNTIKKFIKK